MDWFVDFFKYNVIMIRFDSIRFDSIGIDWNWLGLILFVLRFDLIRFYLFLFDLIWFDSIWFDLNWFDSIWFDLIWLYLIGIDLIWFDLIWLDWIWDWFIDCGANSLIYYYYIPPLKEPDIRLAFVYPARRMLSTTWRKCQWSDISSPLWRLDLNKRYKGVYSSWPWY